MKEVILRYLAVGVAGFFGAIARVFVGTLFGRMNPWFPVGTLVINLSGSLFLGWFLTHITARNASDITRLAIGAGFVGAYTTFSTFAYESTKLLDEGAGIKATANLVGSVVLGLLAVKLGMMLARWS
jgi:fluoride exporter